MFPKIPIKKYRVSGRIPIKIPIHKMVNFNNTAAAVKKIFVQKESENSSKLHNYNHLKFLLTVYG